VKLSARRLDQGRRRLSPRKEGLPERERKKAVAKTRQKVVSQRRDLFSDRI
jgi:hypothetical protein